MPCLFRKKYFGTHQIKPICFNVSYNFYCWSTAIYSWCILQKLRWVIFSRESNSRSTNVRSFVRSLVCLSESKTPKKHKINHLTYSTSTTPLTTSQHHNTTQHNITTPHNITTQHNTTSHTTSHHNTISSHNIITQHHHTTSPHHHNHPPHHPFHLLLERLLSFSACFEGFPK